MRNLLFVVGEEREIFGHRCDVILLVSFPRSEEANAIPAKPAPQTERPNATRMDQDVVPRPVTCLRTSCRIAQAQRVSLVEL